MNSSIRGVSTAPRIFAMVVFSLWVTGCSTVGSNPTIAGPNSDASSSYKSQIALLNSVGNHLYAGFGVGSSRLQPDTSGVVFLDVEDRRESGAQIALGIDLSRRIAIEAHATELGSAGVAGAGNIPGGNVDYQSIGASALFYAGKNRGKFQRHGLSVYGRLGYGYLANTPTESLPIRQSSNTQFLFGAGFEYMTRSGIGLRAEAIAFDSDVRYTQFGLIYRTGRSERRRILDLVEARQNETRAAAEISAALPESSTRSLGCEFDGDQADINFVDNSDELTSAAKTMLDGFADDLLLCEALSVRVSAHTDSRGVEIYNQALSMRRAKSVAEYLSSKGVDQSRLRTEAHGSSMPIASNDTSEGRRINRRVELVLEN